MAFFGIAVVLELAAGDGYGVAFCNTHFAESFYKVPFLIQVGGVAINSGAVLYQHNVAQQAVEPLTVSRAGALQFVGMLELHPLLGYGRCTGQCEQNCKQSKSPNGSGV